MQDRGGERALGKYMSLPTDKFALLDPELIQQLGKGSRFVLSVPRINVRRLCCVPLLPFRTFSLSIVSKAVQALSKRWTMLRSCSACGWSRSWRWRLWPRRAE